MRQLGSTIECYRGESFVVKREFIDEDGAPLALGNGLKNPFVRFTVSSNTFKIDGAWKKNYWLDIGDWLRTDFRNALPFPENRVPSLATSDLFVPSQETVSQVDMHTTIPTMQIAKMYTEALAPLMGGPAIQCSFVPTQTTSDASKERLKITIPVDVSKITENYVKFVLVTWGHSMKFAVNDGTELETTDPIWASAVPSGPDNMNVVVVPKSVINKDGYIVLWLRQTMDVPLLEVGNNTFVFFTSLISCDAITSKIQIGNPYYIINGNSNREYYVYDAETNSYIKYTFVVQKRFLNNDTKKWIGQIYQYEIALCSGKLMTEWLKEVFQTLYPNTIVPNANSELAHYICKKRPDLLEGVNINEPLVSYTTNRVLQGPCKLIVKEN